MYRSASLGGVHLKLDGSAVPPPIFVPHPIINISRGRKKQHTPYVEVRICHINIKYSPAQLFTVKDQESTTFIRYI